MNTAHKSIYKTLSVYRYEILLAALIILTFDKIFFLDNDFFIRYVWPLNMVLIALASFGVFIQRNKMVKAARNIFSVISILLPFVFLFLYGNFYFIQFLCLFFIANYFFIFGEVMYQISMTKEVRLNIILGSICGYFLLSLIALFSFLTIEHNFPNSFHGITVGNLPIVYNELLYFSFITMTSIGFGDIYPLNDISRLTTAFFGIVGQFYMVALVGIIISKFSSK